MTPQEMSFRLKFHEEQANRLLQAHPMVTEFFHHLTQVELLKQQLQAQVAGPAPSVDSAATVFERVPANGHA